MTADRGGDFEIERKFLLRRMPRLPPGARVLRVDQGYVPGTRLRERVRRVREGDRVSYFRTMKFGGGIKRREIEEATTEEVFRALWRATRGRRIRKVRYIVETDVAWEIDRFIGFDLVLAEVELDREDQPVVIPDWLQRVLEGEVTGDPAYNNSTLAR